MCLTWPNALGARVVLVGDRDQHRSVTAGEPLKLLEEKAGCRSRRSQRSCARRVITKRRPRP